MLIRFTVGNFLSFGENQTFSMLPGKGTLKPHHKTKPVQGVSTLKFGLIYGANASGKSNLLKAMEFGQKLILSGSKPVGTITNDFFKLNTQLKSTPAYFDFEFQINGQNYAYGFKITQTQVIEEWLFRIGKKSQIPVFERTENNQFVIKEGKVLKQLAEFTPENRLFLNQIFNSKVPYLSETKHTHFALDWFQNALSIVFPTTKIGLRSVELINEDDVKETFLNILKYFNLGIESLKFKEIKQEVSNIPDELCSHIKSVLSDKNSEKKQIVLFDGSGIEYYLIKLNVDGELIFESLKTTHLDEKGKEVTFDLKDESDGTIRIIELLPIILDFTAGNNVLIVDEIERSIHPNLIRRLIEFFSKISTAKDSQLIFTTHESTLLNQKLIRKDEVWFTVKSKTGETKLHSLEDYNVRFDKDIMKDYLLGRYKGVPEFNEEPEINLSNATGV